MKESGPIQGDTAVTRRKEPRRPRSKRTWELNPVQRARSAPTAGKGYARSRKREVPREEVRVKLHKDAPRPLKIVVLLSGEGRELNEILSYVDNEVIEGEILAVISHNPAAGALRAASERGIRTLNVDRTGFGDAQAFRNEINRILDRLSPDVVVLDGFTGPVRLKDKKSRRVVDRAEALLGIATTG